MTMGSTRSHKAAQETVGSGACVGARGSSWKPELRDDVVAMCWSLGLPVWGMSCGVVAVISAYGTWGFGHFKGGETCPPPPPPPVAIWVPERLCVLLLLLLPLLRLPGLNQRGGVPALGGPVSPGAQGPTHTHSTTLISDGMTQIHYFLMGLENVFQVQYLCTF